tara:strand:+ start:246 stop:443 length:198 start_codon:yes stop_codon:yes gene_type:complete
MGVFKNIFTSLVKLDKIQAIQNSIENEFRVYCDDREKWTQGRRTAENSSIREWEYLNKPQNENRK